MPYQSTYSTVRTSHVVLVLLFVNRRDAPTFNTATKQRQEAVEYVALFREAYRADHWRQDYFVSVQTISGIFHIHLAGVFRLHVASTCHKAHSSRRARQSTEHQDSISAQSQCGMPPLPSRVQIMMETHQNSNRRLEA